MSLTSCLAESHPRTTDEERARLPLGAGSFWGAHRRAASALGITGALLLAACGPQASSQIGGDVGNNGGNGDGGGLTGGEGSGSCDVVATTAIGADDVSSLGFAPRVVFDAVAGSRTLPMRWGGSESWPANATLTPEASETSVTVDIVIDEASAQVEDRQVAEQSCEGGCTTPDIALGTGNSCGDRITFDATVVVTSDNGALADTFPAKFTAGSAHFAEASIELTPGELTGSFDVTATGTSLGDEELGNVKIEQTTLSLAVAGGTLSGKLTGLLTASNDQVAMAGGLDIASFPIGAGCEQGQYLLDADGPLATSAQTALDSLTDFSITWPGESAADLTLSHEVTRACLLKDDWSPESVVLYTTTSALAPEGGIDGDWALEAHVALAPSGEPSEVQLLRQAYLGSVYPGASFAADSGITALSVDPALSGTFSFSINDDLTDDLGATGELTVIEVGEAPDCSNQEPTYEYDEDGNVVGASAPGCEGTPFEELGSATIAAR